MLAELRGFGLTPRQASGVYERWGSQSVSRVQRDPYALVGDLPGVGFQTAEAMGRLIGLAPDSPARARGVLLHLLREGAREGNSCLPGEAVRSRLDELGLPAEAIEGALIELRETRRLVIEDEGDEEWLFLSGLWQDETGLAENVLRLASRPLCAAPTHGQLEAARARLSFTPDRMQQNAVETAFSSPFSVLTGGPGDGQDHGAANAPRAARRRRSRPR